MGYAFNNLRTVSSTIVHAPGALLTDDGYPQGTMCNPEGRVRGRYIERYMILHGTSAQVTCQRCLKARAKQP